MNEYKEIREMLDRWYSGLSTPDEQHRLAEFFSNAEGLPEDLETERALFAAISGIIDLPVEIPADLETRIESTLETEMARERRRASGVSKWRRRIIAACGAAACLLAAWAILHSVVPGDRGLELKNAQLAANADSLVKTLSAVNVHPRADTIAMSALAAQVPTEQPVRLAAARIAKSAKPVVVPDNEADAYEEHYLSKEEEARLRANNYHVVEDEREADIILGSVFAGLEGRIYEEKYCIDDINDQYVMELSKL